MKLCINILILSSLSLVGAQKGRPTNGEIMGRRVTKTLKFLSPLQSLTIFSKDLSETTPRDDFLPKFKAGLTAEKRIKESLARRRELTDGGEFDEYAGKGWEKKVEERERLRAEKEDEIVERAWDRTTSPFRKKEEAVTASSTSGSAYQFVGVVQPPKSDQKVKWYARKRPAGSKWNVRLLHVNKDAIIRDLYTNGKVDIMGKYINTGKLMDEPKEGETPSNTMRPLIKAEYSVKPRSSWNLWNFSPKHFFTDSSGAFWRERRLPSGLYTDGRLVYESAYRYTDGKNGMKPISKLDALLKSKAIKSQVKTKLMKRLKVDVPDVVIEE
mmetsp:Transcript_25541/g.29171  ORF Transcript_25541/g.29171 Transcript_25541/m.29171 type:complete len:327 (-) Transcript_25541:44-1024(-)